MSMNQHSCQELSYIAISLIDYNHDHPKIFIDQKKLKLMIETIKSGPLLYPIHLIKNSLTDRYTIISEKIRLSAYAALNREVVPAIIYNDDSINCYDVVIEDEIIVDKLNGLERALYFDRCVKKGMSRTEICEKRLISAPTLSELLKIAQMPPLILSLCASYEIKSQRILTELSKFEHVEMEDALQQLLKTGKLPRRGKRAYTPKKVSIDAFDESIETLKSRLAQFLACDENRARMTKAILVGKIDNLAASAKTMILEDP